MASINAYGAGSATHTSSSGSTHGGHGGSVSSPSVQYGWPSGSQNVQNWFNKQNVSNASRLAEYSVLNGASSSGVSYGTPSSGAGVAGFGYSNSGVDSDYIDILRQISDANNQFNLQQVREVNDFNAKQAALNREWQERMSNSAHQREVKDLIAAGLNPVLSAGGQGAITGSGATASGQKAVADSIYGNGVISLMNNIIGASSAQAVARTYAAASMYGSNVSAGVQHEYNKIIKDNNVWNNITKIGQSALSMLGMLK